MERWLRAARSDHGTHDGDGEYDYETREAV
jgi:hypothetical protein